MTCPPVAVALRDRWQHQPAVSDASWPAAAWEDLRAAGITGWTIPVEFGGEDRPADVLSAGCLELARGCLLPAFVLSQFQAACQRLMLSSNSELKCRWLPDLAKGHRFATVGISHLTTSRQHVAPAVTATPSDHGFRLSGEIPWVTGASRADVLVVGGTLADGRQILTALPTDRVGVTVGPALRLLSLSGSETGSITLTDVDIPYDEVLAGPLDRVVQQTSFGGAGSLMTSTLATGHAFGCLDFLHAEAELRPLLQPIVKLLFAEAQQLRQNILDAVRDSGNKKISSEQLRTRATDLALRCSQALLTSTKGAGFVAGHPAERLSREVLFFLVWSCPQAVANQLLQNFSGCESDSEHLT